MKTCLIVDDSKIVRVMARRILENFGFQVEEAADGQEALDHCKRQAYDFVLLDRNMPVMDGVEFLTRVRGELKQFETKIVMCSTEDDQKIVRECLEKGADDYIVKPFDETLIGEKLKKVHLL